MAAEPLPFEVGYKVSQWLIEGEAYAIAQMVKIGFSPKEAYSFVKKAKKWLAEIHPDFGASKDNLILHKMRVLAIYRLAMTEKKLRYALQAAEMLGKLDNIWEHKYETAEVANAVHFSTGIIKQLEAAGGVSGVLSENMH